MATGNFRRINFYNVYVIERNEDDEWFDETVSDVMLNIYNDLSESDMAGRFVNRINNHENTILLSESWIDDDDYETYANIEIKPLYGYYDHANVEYTIHIETGEYTCYDDIGGLESDEPDNPAIDELNDLIAEIERVVSDNTTKVSVAGVFSNGEVMYNKC